MRLWHYKLIPHLPRQQLLGQHRECCALRGNGWGKKHATVNYVFDYAPIVLVWYHDLIMHEMVHRGYKVDLKWYYWGYRGKKCKPWTYDEARSGIITDIYRPYLEHDDDYLQECIDNLKQKGIIIDVA